MTTLPPTQTTAFPLEDALKSGAAGDIAVFADDSKEKSQALDDSTMERQASMILSAMDAAGEGREFEPSTSERREPRAERVAFRARAKLKLFADPDGALPWPIFIRDVETRAAGFVCPERLPLGYGGSLRFADSAGELVEVDVTLVRCRVCYGGWFEGALYFHRNQPQLLSRLRRSTR